MDIFDVLRSIGEEIEWLGASIVDYANYLEDEVSASSTLNAWLQDLSWLDFDTSINESLTPLSDFFEDTLEDFMASADDITIFVSEDGDVQEVLNFLGLGEYFDMEDVESIEKNKPSDGIDPSDIEAYRKKLQELDKGDEDDA